MTVIFGGEAVNHDQQSTSTFKGSSVSVFRKVSKDDKRRQNSSGKKIIEFHGLRGTVFDQVLLFYLWPEIWHQVTTLSTEQGTHRRFLDLCWLGKVEFLC